MASWKKVVVSGSSAHLTSVTASTAVLVGTNQQITTDPSTTFLSGSFSGSLSGTATTASYVTGSIFSSTNPALSASYALTASFATNAGASATPNALTFGTGLSGSAASFNGGTAVTVAISGSTTLSLGNIPKWTGTGFANSTISEASTTVTFSDNVTVTKDLIVLGTASFQETTNLTVADRFILLNSGSGASPYDGGIVIQQATQGIGELFGWDFETSRWAVTSSFTANSNTFIPDAFMAVALSGSSATPSVASRYNSGGNIYVSSGDESIWIYS